MDISKKLEQLMAFIYDQYNRDDTFGMYGQYIEMLILDSRIDFGELSSQAIFDQLFERKWIKFKRTSKRNGYYSPIIPTSEGLDFVEKMRQTKNPIKKIAPDIAEISGRFLKGYLGK